jgi:hypothetical protein
MSHLFIIASTDFLGAVYTFFNDVFNLYKHVFVSACLQIKKGKKNIHSGFIIIISQKDQ